MAKYDFDDEDGVWRTVGGRRIFIREGQSLGDAMKSSGKFKSAKKVKAEDKTKQQKAIDKEIKALNDEDLYDTWQYLEDDDDSYKANTIRKEYEKREEIAKQNHPGQHKIEGTKMWVDDDYEDRLSKYKEIQKDANKRYDKGEIDKEERNKLIDDAHDKYIKQKETNDSFTKKESDKPRSEKYLERADREIKETKKVIEGHVAEEREKLKGYIRDNYKNPDDYLKDYDRENAESRIGTRRDKFDKDDKNSYFSEQHKTEKNARDDVVKMIQEIKDEDRENDRIIAEYERKNSGSKADRVAERLGLKKGDSYVNKEGTKVDILEKDDKGQTLHKFTTSDGKTDYKNYNEKDVESMLKHNGYEKQSNNGSETNKEERYNKLSSEDKKIADKEEYEANKTMLKEMERRLRRKDLTDKQRDRYENEAGNYESAIHEYESKQKEEPYKKAFQEYKKQHPNTKLTLSEFIDISEGK